MMDFVKLKFIGGQEKRGKERGPWRSYNTGAIYVLPERFANEDAYPYFKYMGPATEDEIPEPWRTRLGLDEDKAKILAEEYGMSEERMRELMEVINPRPLKAVALVEASEKEPIEAVFEVTGSTDDGEEASSGLIDSSTDSRPSKRDFVVGMDKETLINFLEDHGEKIDKRWNKETLVEQALKLL